MSHPEQFGAYSPQPAPGYGGYPQQPGYQQPGAYQQPGYGGYPQPGYDQSGYQPGAYSQPGAYQQPGYGNPQPGYPQHPQPGYQQPGAYQQPGYGNPQPGAYSPQPGAHSQPQPGYNPQPGYPQHPQPGYVQPGYQQQPGAYQQPGYGNPQQPGAYSPQPGQPGAPGQYSVATGQMGNTAAVVASGPLVKVTTAEIEDYAWTNDGNRWNCMVSPEWWRMQKNTETPEKIFLGSRHRKEVTVVSISGSSELGVIKIHPKFYNDGSIDGDIEGDIGVIVGGRTGSPFLGVYNLETMKETLTWNGVGEDFLECVTLSNSTSLQAAGVGKGFIRIFDVTTGRPCARLANTHDVNWKVEKVRGDPFNPHCVLLASDKGFVYYDLRANARAKTIAGDYRGTKTVEFANQNPMKVAVAHGPLTILDLTTGTATHNITDPEDDYSYEAGAMYGNLAVGWIRSRSITETYDFYNLDEDIVRPVRQIKSMKVAAGNGISIFGKTVLFCGNGSFGTVVRK